MITPQWETIRQKGMLRYILFNGVLSWGVPMYILIIFRGTMGRRNIFRPELLIGNAVLCLLAGVGKAFMEWNINEVNYESKNVHLKKDGGDIIEFELNKLDRWSLKFFSIYVQFMVAGIFVVLIVAGTQQGENFIENLKGSSIFCGILSVFWLLFWLWLRHYRYIGDLFIDVKNRKFFTFIAGYKEPVIFEAKDILKIERVQNDRFKDQFIFYLNEGKPVVWSSFGTNQELLLQTLNSFGLSLVHKFER